MAIEQILRRGFSPLALVLVAVAAYYQARGAAQLLAMRLLGGSVPARRSESSQRQTPSSTKTAPPFTELPRAAAVVAPDPLSWPICEGVQLLIVTESPDPWWSLSTLRAPGDPRPRLFRVGDGVAGKRVAFIGFNPKQQAPSVWLEGREAFCQCMLFHEQPQAAAPRDAGASSAATFNVDRSLVDRGLQRPESLLGPVRVLPEQRNGKLIGLRLFGIRPGSLLGTLGLQNGDRLESINGFSVASPAQALEAYAHLREAHRLHLQFQRVERPLELTLNIN